jgi:hypothetical protein
MGKQPNLSKKAHESLAFIICWVWGGWGGAMDHYKMPIERWRVGDEPGAYFVDFCKNCERNGWENNLNEQNKQLKIER